jgi:biopolymer transport protein ExbD
MNTALGLVVVIGCATSPLTCGSSNHHEASPPTKTEAPAPAQEQVDLALFRDVVAKATHFQLGMRHVTDRAELQQLLAGIREDHAAQGVPAVRIDAAAEVPWQDIADVVGVCRDAGLTSVSLMIPEGSVPAVSMAR